MKKIYYCVLKNYKGIFIKKSSKNTHLFFIPKPNKEYLYLALIGKLNNRQDTYTCQLLVKQPGSLIHQIINGEKEHFGERFEIIESLNCESKEIGEEEFLIKLSNKGTNISSNLVLMYSPDLSSGKQMIYVLKGNLNLYTEEVDTKSTRMLGLKKKSFLGNIIERIFKK